MEPAPAHDLSPASSTDDVRSMRVLVADDAPFNVELLVRILRGWGFEEIKSTTDSSAIEGLVQRWRPDLLMLDFQMPAPDGFEVMRRIRQTEFDSIRMPIIMLTADTTIETRRRALSLGADDFLCKPFDFEEVCLRASNILRARQLEVALAEKNAELEDSVAERTEALERAHMEMLERLARVAEYRDDDTHHHTERVGRIAAQLAAVLGLDAEEVELIRQAAPLHDIGKVAIPDPVLLKPGKLTRDEFELVKTHTTIGGRILAGAGSAPLRLAATIATTHHERWDGQGYPSGLSGKQIPLQSRIVMVADVFDALTHERPYKDAMPIPEALVEMRAMTGTFFDPWVMRAFEGLDHVALISDGPATIQMR
ncbi:MAG: response regulator [Solirubrobacteraceae bacterium]|nr:response regulator [Solirubrobacteraceae bacterium]